MLSTGRRLQRGFLQDGWGRQRRRRSWWFPEITHMEKPDLTAPAPQPGTTSLDGLQAALCPSGTWGSRSVPCSRLPKDQGYTESILSA